MPLTLPPQLPGGKAPGGKAPVGLDREFCEREPIHIPGATQPHGAVLAARIQSLRVTHCSANLADILGRPPAAVLGSDLSTIIGPAALEAVLGLKPYERISLGTMQTDAPPSTGTAQGRVLHLNGFHSGDRICVDIEPARSDVGQQPSVKLVQSVLESFKRATSQSALCTLASKGLRAITGYDRVMIYRFGKSGDGAVVSEFHARHLKPWLGNHYPTTDIPPQARRQYMLQRVGAVADAAYVPVPLLTGRRIEDATPLDLTYSALRSVSPIHREFMRNMGTAASLTVALTYGPDLWGLIICHHSSPHIAGPELRAVVDMVGQVVSLLLGSLHDAEIFASRTNRQSTLRAILDQLAAPVPLGDALAKAQAALLHLVGATGAVVRVGGVCRCFGRTPDAGVGEQIIAALQATPHGNGDPIAIGDLGLRHPQFAPYAPVASGALLLELSPLGKDVILWLRQEQSRTVTWAGNPDQHAEIDPVSGRLAPRASFAAWTQTTTGQSDPWTAADETLAHDLRQAIEAEAAHRSKSERAWHEHYRELSESLEHKVQQRSQVLEAETQERQRTGAILQQAQKMEAIGQLTGGVAHDFNNVLAAVLGNLELAQARATDPAVKKFLRNAQQAAERGAKLTDHLLSFARKQPLRRESCDLNRLSTDFAALIRRTVGAAIEVRLTLAAGLWPVMLDATQFEMALLNLAVNASHAMPGGGVIEISTRNVPAGSDGLPGDLDPGDYTCVAVQDDGSGMSAEVAARAFEPFYTTSTIGKSTGLGLSQVYGLSKQLGGTTILTSRAGRGTCVSLLLPRALHAPLAAPVPQSVADQSVAVTPPADVQPTDARLLVIDDDPDVREVTVETLRALGFDVVAAESAKLGLDILHSGLELDLVVTDFSMPEMNGIEFIRHAHLSHPQLPCLLVTGYAETSDFAEAISGGITILRKPYRMKELAATIERLRA
ncbi:response regulator [Lichenicoccus sp.]|uniref:response regulator n=1 Tax=Lichenicoccus sp. TaxID=2781899 RepID=UPI003D0BB55C